MNKLWPVIVLLVIISLGAYIWVQKEPYNPYSVDEIDKMLAQDPPWMKQNGEEVVDEENLEEMILDSDLEEVVDESKMAESTSNENDSMDFSSEVRSRWDEKIRSFLENELQVKPSLISAYEKPKLEYDQKKTSENKAKLFDQYSEKLKRIFGRNVYIRYLEEKHHYNKEISEQVDFEIEF